MAKSLFPGEWYKMRITDKDAFVLYCYKNKLHYQFSGDAAYIWVSCLDELCAMEGACSLFEA